ncbi:MAG: hypothetical protein IJI45_17650, partial [Anaerolineaceae bacterium]|nr:hypothetical protein [Anaerolineaceae bacterium]
GRISAPQEATAGAKYLGGRPVPLPYNCAAGKCTCENEPSLPRNGRMFNTGGSGNAANQKAGGYQ